MTGGQRAAVLGQEEEEEEEEFMLLPLSSLSLSLLLGSLTSKRVLNMAVETGSPEDRSFSFTIASMWVVCSSCCWCLYHHGGRGEERESGSPQ